MSTVPSTLKYYLKQMKGISVNWFKIYPTSNIIANNGAQVSVLLPQNTIIDLDTFALYATLTIPAGFAPPKNSESLIYSIQVTVNGQVIQNPCMNTNLLFNTLYDLQNGTKQNNLRNVMALGGGVTLPSSNTSPWNPANTASPTSGAIVISNFPGFLSTAAPRKLDTSILGDVRVILTLAGPEVLVSSTTAPVAVASWYLNNLYFGVSALSIDDGVYYSAINSKLKESPIEIPFKYYTNFVGSTGGSASLRTTLASESINYAIATVQTSTLAVQGSVSGVDATLANAAWFTRDGSLISDSVMMVNNVFFPSYPAVASSGEIFQQTCDALDLTHQNYGAADTPTLAASTGLSSFAAFNKHYFTHIVKFCIDMDDPRPAKTGISTIGNSAQLIWKMTSTSTTTIPHLFIEATGVVEVHSGRQLNLCW